jgi:peptidoglycan/xylan/chitin deacetylase (PgdA/CDA1 family)
MLAIIAIVIAGAALLSHLAPFPFVFEAFRPSKSLWRIHQKPGTPPALYLTFDDGPNPDWTPALLDALRDTDARATFFLIDEHLTPETAPIVARMASEGHAIGLHSGSRRLMMTRPEEVAEQLRRAADRIAMAAGVEPCRLFRPHAGWRSAAMYEGLDAIDYRLTGWTWGMWDWDWWRRPQADRVAARVARKASPGDIIVIHDGHHEDPRADRQYAGETVRQLVPVLRARGYEFRVLCERTTSPE